MVLCLSRNILSTHISRIGRVIAPARSLIKALCLILAFAAVSAPEASYAQAQCIKVVMNRGKARLAASPVGFNGQCPFGSVPVGAATGSVGAPGAQGPQGSQGPAGAQGPRGASAFDLIPSGTTVYGVVGMRDFRQTGDAFVLYSSLPARSSKLLKGSDIIIKANTELLTECSGMKCLAARQQAGQSRCQGSASRPSAASGTVCVYPTYVRGGIGDGSLDGADIWADDDTGSAAGFTFQYWTNETASHWFEGVWAYTAP